MKIPTEGPFRYTGTHICLPVYHNIDNTIPHSHTTYYSTFGATEYFSEIEKFHGFQHINTSRITLHIFLG